MRKVVLCRTRDQGKEAIEAENKALKLSPENEEFKKNLKLHEMGVTIISKISPTRITMKRYSFKCVLICGFASLTLTLFTCGKEDVPVHVQFSPVITAVGAQRNDSSVTFTAMVSDTGPQSALTYRWGFDGGLAFVNNTTNPAVLQGYDETRSGNLTLTVTNGAGAATTVSYYIAPGLLPDNVVISVAQMGRAIKDNSLNLFTAFMTLIVTIDA